MRTFLVASFLVVAIACNSPSSGGSGSVSGTIAGNTLSIHDVVGVVGTVAGDGGVSSYAAVLLSDTGGTCANAQQGGVRSATSQANVLEIAATSTASAFAPGTYTVGSSGLAEYFYTKGGVAGGGSITFTVVNSSTLAGSFDLNLAGGQHVTGSFSAVVCQGVPATPSPF